MARGEGIKKLSHLFEKYTKNLIAPERTVIAGFLEVTSDLYGWDLKKESVTYNPRTKVLSLAVSGPFKTEMQLHKEEILTHLKGRLGEKSAPKDIF
jgi:hypothetical protein